jgi:hypothetical protein
MQAMTVSLAMGVTSTLRTARAATGATASVHAARSADVARLVAAGEEALRAGDAAAAASLFEHAAEREHSSDIERGIVLAHMQGGHYRRALAFAAHVARSHPQVEGSMLFAQLLDAGGQPQLARRVLSRAERLESGSTAPPKTFGPAASGVIASLQAKTVATGAVIDAGLHVAVPAAALPSSEQPLWVRDGLGRTANATRLRDAPDLGLALLRIDEPWLDTPAPLATDRPAFAGSVVHVMAHASTAPHAAWPVLRSGFLRTEGRTDGALGVPRVDAQRMQGGAVFDAQGRWMGVWVEPEGGGGVLVPAQALMSRFGQAITVSTEARRPLDEIYGRAMRWTVQVLAAGEARHP